MANFDSIFEGNPSQANLETEINNKLHALGISSMVSSSLYHASDDTNKAGLVFALETGDKLQVKLFHENSMANLQVAMDNWIKGEKRELVKLAITYGGGQNRAMLIYKPLNPGGLYSVKCISKDTAGNMHTAVDTEIQDKSEVISDSTFGGGKFRTVLITKKFE